jgi:enoyl-CoA hydratase/carnithine racemase
MTEYVLSTVSDGVRTITLNRPDNLNAMNLELVEATRDAFREANADDATRVVIFTGAGRAFCAGDDLKDDVQHAIGAEAEQYNQRFINALQDVTREIVLGDRFVVGAINGWAVGGGFEWALNCDLPIWAESAKGFFPEIYWGMFVTGGVTRILPNLVGMIRAKEMILLGEKFTARQLEELGVAWRVVADDVLMDEARQVAAAIADRPATVARALKRTLTRAVQSDLETALTMEAEVAAQAALDPESKARIATFGETKGR